MEQKQVRRCHAHYSVDHMTVQLALSFYQHYALGVKDQAATNWNSRNLLQLYTTVDVVH